MPTRLELLMVLERPEIPLHTNGSRTTSAARSPAARSAPEPAATPGRDCRDAFLGPGQDLRQAGVAFWDYFGSRLDVPGQIAVRPLSDLVRCRGQPA